MEVVHITPNLEAWTDHPAQQCPHDCFCILPEHCAWLEQKCPDCGTLFVARKKWNNGNPKWFVLPDCDCEEERTFAEVELRIRTRKARDAFIVG